jgi:hypothetical protein
MPLQAAISLKKIYTQNWLHKPCLAPKQLMENLAGWANQESVVSPDKRLF